jgi:VCBS repeat protein
MSDVLWRDTSGNVAIWEMNGTTILNPNSSFIANVAGQWSIAVTGDSDGDGKSDLLWRDTSGNNAVWFMDGTTVASTAFLGNVPTNWTVQAANAD